MCSLCNDGMGLPIEIGLQVLSEARKYVRVVAHPTHVWLFCGTQIFLLEIPV